MISYIEQNKNVRLDHYFKDEPKNKCKICGATITSDVSIIHGTANKEFCYSCNVKRGLIK